MKRSAIKRGTKPLAPGKGFAARSKPMPRGTSTLTSKQPMKRATKLMRKRSKTNSNPRPKTGEAELCRGQPCYLLVPGILAHPGDTVVPCHSNQNRHGKSMGMKAHDRNTVPGCAWCHREIDQGNRFTRAEKFALWDAAFARWELVRISLLKVQDEDSPSSVIVAL